MTCDNNHRHPIALWSMLTILQLRNDIGGNNDDC